MTPILGDYVLEQWRAAVVEKQRYDNGRWRRSIIIRGTTTPSKAPLLTAALACWQRQPFLRPVLLRLRARLLGVRRAGLNAPATRSTGRIHTELEGLTPGRATAFKCRCSC